MPEVFVLDGSILLYDAEAIYHFPKKQIILPSVVIEELDQKKHFRNEVGKNARNVMRYIDYLSKFGNLLQGVTMSNGSLMQIVLDEGYQKNCDRLRFFVSNENRHRLLSLIYHCKTKMEMVLISKDPMTKIFAEAFGIKTRNYPIQEDCDDSYQGISHLEVSLEEIHQFYATGEIFISSEKACPNHYVLVRSSDDNFSILGRTDRQKQKIIFVPGIDHVWNVKPRNIEQKCALDLLLRKEVKLIALFGIAGSGKTLLSFVAGLQQVFDRQEYSRLVLARPVIPLGRDIGFLPGSKEEKLHVWMAPFLDNLEYICTSFPNGSNMKKMLLEDSRLQIEALTYIRGRSISDSYVIIDEAQNLTPHEMKTIISRAGSRTKIVILGDPSQIDNPYLDVDSNGLTFVIHRMKWHDIFGFISFQKSERSELSELAANLL